MKLVLFFLINILFSDSLSDWIDLNHHIIDSKSYKISFNQKMESIIGGSAHYILDTNTNIIFFKNQIRYESSDRIIIANKDSIKLLNKNNNQLFIDYTDIEYNFLFEIDLINILKNDNFIERFDNNYYHLKLDNLIDAKIFFNNAKINIIKVLANSMDIELSNINFMVLDTLNINKYFDFDNISVSTFDLRAK